MQPRRSADGGDGFDEVWPVADRIPGWLTREQGAALHEAASSAPADLPVVEIGSHHGRSTVVLAHAAHRVVAIDPFPADWRYGAAGTEATFRENLVTAGLADRVELRVTTSRDARETWEGTVGLVYVDGKHDYWSARHDLGWAAFLPPGGWILVHDAFSSLGVTLALLRTALGGHRLRYVDRVGSLARLQAAPSSARDRLRVLRELPWWGRNLMVKVALRARLLPVARLLGHRGRHDPF